MGPYVYVGNTPINAIDPDGKEIIFIVRDNKGNTIDQLKYRKGNFWHQDGSRYNPGKESLSPTLYKVLASYRKIESSGDKTLIRKLKQLEISSKLHYVEHGVKSVVGEYDYYTDPKELKKLVGKGIGVGSLTYYNFSKEQIKQLEESTGVPSSHYTTVAHEIQHQYDYDQGNNWDSQNVEASSESPAEIRAVFFENLARQSDKKLKNFLRIRYGKEIIQKSKLENPPNNN